MRSFAMAALVLVLLASSSLAQQVTILTPPGTKPVGDAASYGIGYQIGMQIAHGGLTTADMTQADFLNGFLDALGGKDPAVGDEVIDAALELLGKKVQERKLAVNTKFLEDNKKKDGVQVTPTGLQFQVLKAGNGATPKADSTVTVHYEGTLVSGQIFDSSIRRQEPASFGVSQVIPGWTEALLRMKVGDKWRLVIPSNLAYGEGGAPGGVIGPNEPLIFEVELLDVK